MAGRCLCWCGSCSRSMHTGPMPRRCHGSRLIAIIWPGRQRRIVPARMLPGGKLWRGWKRPRAWPRMIPDAPEQMRLALSEPLTAALTAQARRHGLTLNTVIQTAWAILLGRLTGREDVVFGVTVAGRPPEVAGIENMVGLFINTLPLRVQLPPGTALLELLRQVQASQSRLMEHQHLGLAEVQGLAGLGELFDTLVVFENYPVDRAGL